MVFFVKIVLVFPTGRSGGAYQTSHPSVVYGIKSLVKIAPVRQNRTIANHLDHPVAIGQPRV